ncbi:MAG: C-terminal binding protein [Dehalococcoidia bacterium]|jgi:D-3-phosphoglycerate dehydrogenase|nr:C-terminal binding protein [Dehalococcoidia bacterium]MDP6228532.1 C-terminal binding protein [Dehalococcoidia bacterium]MDP7085414.1 C-terminal binding protein [Dehalococcoidia bacterium]MDP7202183.1 C-terminal binding protein [Dehalococcoidia bacterium]MDP7510226.1 C-terminal binding protein [Dehalococcoidia bacterium]
MATRKPSYRVLVTDYVWPSTGPEREVLASIGAEIIEAPDPSAATLASLAADVDAIMVCFAQVTDEVVRAARKCVVISRYGVGVDNIAVDTATQEGIAVTYIPDYCVDEVSDHVMALLLTWNRQVGFYDRVAKEGRWKGVTSPVPLIRLRGSTLGVIGLGRIGRAVAEKAGAFGMEILVHDPYLPPAAPMPAGVKRVDLPGLLAQSDYITVHTPLNDETRGLVGAPELAQMKPSAFIINCARGPILDEAALYAALRDRKIAGAGLDVMEQAAPPAGHPLFQLDNVLVTPHVAFLSRQSVFELEVRTAQSTADVLQGKMPEFLVNPAVLPQARIQIS